MSTAKEAELMERERSLGTLRGRLYLRSGAYLEVGDHKEGVVPFSSGDPFMYLCRHPIVVQHLGVLIARVKACAVHNNDL